MGLLAEHSALGKFKALLRDRVAPELRRLGLKGSGQVYELPSESHSATLHIQKSRFGDRTYVEFTVEVLVVDRDEEGAGWRTRIGQLMPSGKDQ